MTTVCKVKLALVTCPVICQFTDDTDENFKGIDIACRSTEQ